MATTGHESEAINVQGLKASMQKLKAEYLDSSAYLEDGDSSSVIADFDPQADTLWKKAQVLSAAERAQVQQNIGVREWLNNLTGEKFVSVTATAQTSDVTTLLPASGAVDTIYRVGMWDGTAYNQEYYSDYAWDGTAYVQLNKKSIVGEVFDISEYNGGASYANLAAALGVDGANVPESVRKGGMSIKYVSNSDNKYVQYKLTSTSFSTNIFDWQSVDIGNSLINNDSEPASKNSLILDSAYAVEYYSSNFRISTDGIFGSNAANKHVYIPVSAGDKYHIEGIEDYELRVVFATTRTATAGENVPAVSGTGVYVIPANTSIWVNIPIGCSYLLLWRNDVATGFSVKKALSIDKTPTTGSPNYVESGGVKSATDSIAQKLDWQLEPMPYAYKMYPNATTGKFETYSSGGWCAFYAPVKEGELLKLDIVNVDQGTCYCFSTDIPAVDVACTNVTPITSDTFAIIKAPYNGYITIFRGNNKAAYLYKIKPSDTERCIRRVQNVMWSGNKVIDCLPSSETYGQLITAGYSNWAVTNAIDISRYPYLYIPVYYTNAVFAYSASNGMAGGMFYNENMQPIASIVSTRSSVSTEGYAAIKVPTGAKYVRILGYIASYKPILYGLDVSVIEKDRDSIADTLTFVLYGTYGADNSFQNGPEFTLHAGNRYRAIIEYPLSNVAISNYGFGIYRYYEDIVNGETVIKADAVMRWTSNNVPDYYEFDAIAALDPDNTENPKPVTGYCVSFRIPLGDKAVVRFIKADSITIDISEALANDARTVKARTIFELNPDTEMLQKMVIANKKTDNGSAGSSTIPTLTLMQISDAHGGWTQYTRYIEFANHWKDKGYIDELIDTGDVVNSDYTDGTSGRDAIEGVKNVMTVIGNHDTRASSAEKSAAGYPAGQNQWQYHSSVSLDASKRTDAYNLLLVGPDNENPYIDAWDVTQPSNAAENGLCYYYKDYVSQGIRLIALDAMSYEASQDAWLAARLAEAITLGYHVLIMTHFTGTSMTSLKCNYSSLREPGAFGGGFNEYLESENVDGIAKTVNNFQDNGGIFIGYIIGHYHCDMVNVVTNYPKQLVFAVSSGGKTTLRDFTKVSGCKSYDDFQVVSVNTYDKTVRLIKVGADTDYYMRKKGTLCVGYTLVKDDGTEPGSGETATKVKGVIGEGW